MASTTFLVDSVGGISGSLTRLINGTSYLVAGQNINIVSQSNGQVTISQSLSGSVGDSGIYGDGSDGNVVLDGVTGYTWATLSGSQYTLKDDIYPASLIISGGVMLKTSGYRVFVNGSCVVSGSVQNSSSDMFGAPGGTVGAGANGGDIAPGGDGMMGGAGGNGLVTTGGQASRRGPRSMPFVLAMSQHLPSGSSYPVLVPAGAGGGGSGVGNYGGGGGGFVIIAAKSIVVALSASILANGGPGSGTGGGGGGGTIVLASQSPVSNVGTIQAVGGAGTSNGLNGIVMQFLVI